MGGPARGGGGPPRSRSSCSSAASILSPGRCGDPAPPPALPAPRPSLPDTPGPVSLPPPRSRAGIIGAEMFPSLPRCAAPAAPSARPPPPLTPARRGVGERSHRSPPAAPPPRSRSAPGAVRSGGRRWDPPVRGHGVSPSPIRCHRLAPRRPRGCGGTPGREDVAATASGISRWRHRGRRGDSSGDTAVTSPGTSRRQHRGRHGGDTNGDTATALSAPRPRVTAAAHAGISPLPPARPREPRDGAHTARAGRGGEGGSMEGGRELRVPAAPPGRGVTAPPRSVGVEPGGRHPDPPPHSAQPERAPSGPPRHRHPSVTVTQLRRCRHAVTRTPLAVGDAQPTPAVPPAAVTPRATAPPPHRRKYRSVAATRGGQKGHGWP